MTDWLVYKCTTCGAETRVNLVHAHRWDGCCWRGHHDGHTLIDVIDHHQFCGTLRSIATNQPED